MRFFLHLFNIYYYTAKRFYFESYSYRASALAFTTLLALVPIFFVGVFIITAFPVFTQIILLSEHYILNNFLPESAASVQFYFSIFIEQTKRLPMISIVFLFVTAILLVNTIEETFNAIWHAPERSKTLYSISIYWLTLLLIPLIIGFSVFISSYITSLAWISSTTAMLGITKIFLNLVPLIINTLLFSLIYIFVPNKKVDWHYGVFGAFNAAVICESARVGFTLYIKQFPSYSLIYGTFAIIPIFLLWLYIFWLIVLFGGLLSYTYANYKEHKQISFPDFPS